jgi:hypothetical protein
MREVADALGRFVQRSHRDTHEGLDSPALLPVPADSDATTTVQQPDKAHESIAAGAAQPGAGSNRRTVYLKLFAAIAAVVVVLCGITLLIHTPAGTLRIEVNDAALEVRVDDLQIPVNGAWEGQQPEGKCRLRVKVGGQEVRLDAPVVLRLAGIATEHRLVVQVNGATLRGNEIAIVRGETTIVKITHSTTVLAAPLGDVFAEHLGNQAPTTEGWDYVAAPGVQVGEGPVESDGVAGIAAWYVDDNAAHDGGALGYTQPLADEAVTRALRNGWVLRARLRVVDAPDAVDWAVRVAFLAGDRCWDMVFGSEPNGDPVVRLPELESSGPGLTVRGGAGQYHLYELKYDPRSATAALWVDGIQRIESYAGCRAASPEVAIRWGSGDSLGTGQGNYNLVQFDVLRDTP